MKKRISIILVIAILCVTMVASFAGCSKPLSEDEAKASLNDAIVATEEANQYLIKSTYIYSLKKTISNNMNVFPDENGNPMFATITVVTNDNSKTSYKTTRWGASLKKGVKVKDATADDYKKNVLIENNKDKSDILNNKKHDDGTKITDEEKEAAKKLPDFYMTPMAFAEFAMLDDIRGYSKMDLMASLRLVIASGQMIPAETNPYTRNGVVNNYNYADIGLANAILLNIIPKDENGLLQVEDGKAFTVNDKGEKTYFDKFPLFIETTNGKISKVVGQIQEVGKNADSSIIKRKYYITMQGPNINLPSWTDEGYTDDAGVKYPNYEIKSILG